MALILDQIGLNARSMDDILFVDSALSGYDVKDIYPNPKTVSELRVGVPLYPFVNAYIPTGCKYRKRHMPLQNNTSCVSSLLTTLFLLFPTTHIHTIGGDNPFGYAAYPTAYTPSVDMMAKYNAVKTALKASGATLVEEEWPQEEGDGPGVNVLAKALFLQQFNGAALSMGFHVFHTYMGQVHKQIHCCC